MKDVRWSKKSGKNVETARTRRASASSPQRPVYSYYSSQKISSGVLSQNSGRSTGQHDKQKWFWSKPGRLSGGRAAGAVYATIIVICLAKVLILVPEVKIVVPDNVVGRLSRDTYAERANQLLAQSLFNRTKPTVNANGIAAELKRQFPELEKVVVTIPILGNRPVVYTVPARPAIIVDTTGGRFTVDEKGYALTRLSADDSPKLVTVREQSSRRISPGTQYLAGSTVKFAQTVAYELEAAGFMVKSLSLPSEAPYELTAMMSNASFIIRFNLQADPMAQSGGAVATLQQLGNTPPVQYLDVRVPGRVYYR